MLLWLLFSFDFVAVIAIVVRDFLMDSFTIYLLVMLRRIMNSNNVRFSWFHFYKRGNYSNIFALYIVYRLVKCAHSIGLADANFISHFPRNSTMVPPFRSIQSTFLSIDITIHKMNKQYYPLNGHIFCRSIDDLLNYLWSTLKTIFILKNRYTLFASIIALPMNEEWIILHE